MSAYGKADWLPAFIEKFKIQFLLESDGKKISVFQTTDC